MHKSKILALLLAVAMVVSMVVVPVYAEGEISFNLTADKTTVAPGEPVVVTLNMASNAGFGSIGVGIKHEGLIYTSAENVCQLTGCLSDFGTPDSNTVSLGIMGTGEVTGTGDLLKVTLTAPETEGTYTVSMVATDELLADDYSDLPDGYVDLSATVTITVEVPVPYACPEHKDVTTWTEVNEGDWGDNKVITTGHYKLNADIQLTAVATDVVNEGQGSSLMIAENQNVCVDLNGHTIEALQDDNDGSRVFTVLSGASLTIMDTTAKTVDGVYTAGKITGGMARGHDMIQPADSKGNPNPIYTEVAAYRNDAGGNIYVQNGATFTLVSGIIADGWVRRASNYAESRGGNIYGEAGSTINIKGGEVKDGKVTRGSGSAGTTAYYGGGNIGSQGTVNITGGTISGGVVSSAGSSSISYLFGGNIVVMGTSSAHAVLNITDATIKNGTVTNDTSYKTNGAFGGNIAGYYADITITDSAITDGTAQTINADATTSYPSGGNISMDYGNLTIGGNTVVSGGVAESAKDTSGAHGGNIYFAHLTKFVMKDDAQITDAKLRVYGAAEETLNTAGTGANVYVYGVSTSVNGTVEIHDNVQIPNGQGGSQYSYAVKTDYYTQLYVYGGTVGTVGIYTHATVGRGDRVYLYAGELTMGITGYCSYVYVQDCACGVYPVQNDEGKYTTTNYAVWQPNLDANNHCATCDHTYANPIKGSHNYAVTDGVVGACSCGATPSCGNAAHTDITWSVWDGSQVEGHYVMTGDVTVSVVKTIAANTDFCLDMNGYTITNTAQTRVFNVNSGANMSLVGGGTINQSNGGSTIIGTINMGGNSLTMKGITITGSTRGTTSGAMAVTAGTVLLEDCVFDGNRATKNGGQIDFRAGTATVTNCTFIDGYAGTAGGNVHVQNAAVTMTGCTFIGGEAGYGGNLSVYAADADVVLDGCSLTGGSATTGGGNIYWYKGSLTTKNNTVISGGTSTTKGGNICVEGALTGTLKDLVVSGGVAPLGGNLAVFTYGGNVNVTLDGGTYTGAKSDTIEYGGNIYVTTKKDNAYSATLNANNCTITDGQATMFGGNISVYPAASGSAALNLTECVISNGRATTAGSSRGGNISIDSRNGAVVTTLTDCEVSNGFAARGGNLSSDRKDSLVTIDGGTYTGSMEDGMDRGGNLFLQRGYDAPETTGMTIKGNAQIIGGYAEKGGAITSIYSNLNLVDCDISGGKADVTGGNVELASSSGGSTTAVIEKDVIISGGKVNGEANDLYVGASGSDVTKITIKTGASVGAVVYDEFSAATVEAGVTSLTVLPGATSHYDAETETYVTKATAADAIDAVAGTGDVVTLGKAETVDALSVDNFVLDLAGQTLTATSVTATNSKSKVIDTVGGGKLASADVTLYKDNGYLPVKTEDGYYLEEVAMKQKVDAVDETTKKVKFVVSDAADATYLDECLISGEEVKFFVTVNHDDGSVSKSFPASVVKQYVGENGADWGKKMFVCTIKGLDKIENATFSASIEANGVEIAAVDVSVN